ncbi:FUSC family protein [Amaricoccus solimangrovi]|uniref:FUSC family protein n=1 Tax=Amaricoccus solimangrovi TaxID=2589815 RepID=A0A501WV91_9RHOB|nr:FUSC family protein [Amaricoccus solimangrovi]TPE52034.1 FUSC family protein [Amaricoccus solimangrovi]
MDRYGFDAGRLAYGLRVALGACVALILSWLLGLEHPQWAAMTVWAASQPVRAHLVEKSLFRGAGTLVGVVFGVALTALSLRLGGAPLIVLGLALWVGICAGAGNLLRGFASYGALLAGYSAVMVAVLDSAHPEDVAALGLDRAATVLLGVAVALVVGLLTPAGVEAEIPRRLRLANATILRQIAAALRDPATVDNAALTRTLSDLAVIDDEIDGDGAGSLAARREARNRRVMLMAQVAAILWLRAPTAAPDPERAGAIDAIAARFEAHAPAAERRVALARAARQPDPELRKVLADLGAALPRQGEPPEPDRRPEPLILHRDWALAREAGTRAGAAILAIGFLWVVTGWTPFALVMLGASIMTSVFSTFENPLAILPKVAVGQALGAAGAIACRWLVWPHMGGEAGLVLSLLPFILLGGLLTGHRRTQAQAFDYNMVVLLLSQPLWPLTGSPGHSVLSGAAVVAAPLLAWLAFRYIHPPSAARRRDALARAMVLEVEAMAARPGAASRLPVWRARLRHRLLRLIRWSDRTGAGAGAAAAEGLALLRLGQAVGRLDARIAEAELAGGARRRLTLARARIAGVSRRPRRAAAALDAAARLGGRDAPVFAAAAESIRDNAAFLAGARLR